ncbi:MAG: GTPase ObgE [Candidatus Portnoybacteria bacterium]|nr:GTPase ObgE [Candidatus Portnoybacteria bacterium]
MLIDDVIIKIKAGNGGKGAVAFNNVKMALGPTGASGGRGGDVYLQGVSDLNALSQFRFKKNLEAQDGGNGKTQFNDGADGKDLILKVPVGTVGRDLKTGQFFEIISIGQKEIIAKGGRGGKGNFKFRSPKNTSPQQFQSGLPGEERDFRLELKMIADVGFVGLPNVGKSSLLNALTNAKSKVANYKFTTLEPNLGVYYELILADIPGLIEGASKGKGLGLKFLRHIERTKTIFHFISAESDDPARDYKTIREEIGLYNPGLLKKTEYVFLSKSDLVEKETIREKISAFKEIKKEIIPISILDQARIKKVEEILRDVIRQKKRSA